MFFYLKPFLIGLICIVLQCFATTTHGQDSYDFSYNTGTYTDLTGSTSLNNAQTWDDPEYVISIGFSFEFFDQAFDSIHISDRIWFDAANKYRIYAYSADYIDLGSGSSLSPISYLLSGTPGNQILKIEWQNAGFYDDNTTSDFINLQLWLYEGSNDIEVRVGPNSVLNPDSYGGDEGGVVGLWDRITNKNTYLIGDENNPVQTTVISGIPNLNGTPVNGTIYNFGKCPSASFGSVIDSGLTVSLTGSLAADITGYYWDFGDGSWDTISNPTHTYLDSGQYTITLVVYSNCSADTSSEVVYMGVTSIDEHLLLSHQLDIYPNPANDLLNISLVAHPKLESMSESKMIHIQIVDIMGRTVYFGEAPILNGAINSKIDISSLEAGTYIIQIQAGKLKVNNLIIKN